MAEEKKTAVEQRTPAVGGRSMTLVNSVVGNLSTMETSDVELAREYWSPDAEGETRRMVFFKVDSYPCLDQQSNEPIEIDAVYFVQPTPHGNKMVAQGSKRLLGIFEGGSVESGTGVEITYLGKQKNSTNKNEGASWSVKVLKPATKPEAGSQDGAS